MLCENCGIKIKDEFSYAIQNNQCPACGKSIMKQEKLSVYLSLCTLFDQHFKEINSKHAANLIISNFDVKQIFDKPEEKTAPADKPKPEPKEEKISEEDKKELREFVQEGGTLMERDDKKNREVLKKMRDEALSGAMQEKYGVGSLEDGILFDDNKSHSDQESSRQNVVSGVRGAFRRDG